MSDKKLERILKSSIRKSGAITFAQFMSHALYHPRCGYYSKGAPVVGKQGDFYTSPHAHSAFGETLSRFVSGAYRAIGAMDFTVVEMGGGEGLLAKDILDSVKRNDSELYRRIRYLLVEISRRMRDEGKKTLSEHSHKVRWLNSLSSLKRRSVSGVFISNELVDSLPFHRAKLDGGELVEILVSLKNDSFIETPSRMKSPGIEEYFGGYNLELEQNQAVEIRLSARKWLREIASVLSEGFILTIDYGSLARELFDPVRMEGTLRCFHKHTINDNPYINIGEQDITANVDFSDLIRVGKSLGLSSIKYTTQGQFLIDWGILDILESLSPPATDDEKTPKHAPYERGRMAVKNLFLPGLMGDRFKILLQGKNLGAKIGDFYPKSPFTISFLKPEDRLG